MSRLAALALTAGLSGLVSLCACGIVGASLRGQYETDVRFEHCMALDAESDKKPTVRRACWEEWLSFYTFEQTRDRIEYAKLRRQQLGATSDFDEADQPIRGAAVAPDPTSAIAPPPMMMVAADGGLPDASAPETEADERTAGLARCAAACQDGLTACTKTCKATPPCERACAARLKRCTARCEVRPASR